jgi:type IV pilus assembly protein PilM
MRIGKFELNLPTMKRRSHPLIGVDIGSSSIKLVELSRVGEQYQLERFAIEPLPTDAFTDGSINNLDAVVVGLRRAWERSGSRTRDVCLAIPSAGVITKRVLLPAGLQEDELELQVESEASQYVPFPMEDTSLDFQVLGPAPGNAEDVSVFIAATRKANVEDRVAAAQSAGLRAAIIDVESYAVQAACESLHLAGASSSAPVALVDIGANTTNINILKDGESIYTRDQPVGGEQLTHQIQAIFGMSLEDAEIAKRKGGLPDNYVNDLLAPFREHVASEIVRALQFFYSAMPYNTISHILLVGGGAATPGMVEAIERLSGIPTALLNPFSQVKLAAKLPLRQLQAEAPSLLIACGLALRRFDAQ